MENAERIYLDYNATTPLEPEVVDAITDALRTAWGNPSSSYHAGAKAKSLIEESRQSVADMIAAQKNDIIFTSGGTEANNMILETALKYFLEMHPVAKLNQCRNEGGRGERMWQPPGLSPGLRPHIITSNLEHDSIKLVLQHYQLNSLADVTYVAASRLSGRVEAEDVMAAVRPNTCMITIMTANNETGIIQPIAQICEKVKQLKRDSRHETPRILLHTDAAQAIGKICVNVHELQVDYLTIVGHKFYGPRIGAVYVKDIHKENPLYPMLYGGGQERNLRPGTENTGMIAGLGKAADLVTKNLSEYESHMREVRDHLETRLLDTFGKERIHFNGKFPQSERIPNTCNVSIMGEKLQGSRVLAACQHTQASIGAACHSQSTQKASPILLAVGISAEVAANALRLSVGRHTTKDQIERVVEDLRQAVAQIHAQT